MGGCHLGGGEADWGGAHHFGVPGEVRVVGTADGVVMRWVSGPRPAQPRGVYAGGGVVERRVENVRRLQGAAGRR